MSKRDEGEVRRAVSRLEQAINDLIASAGESAAGHIERAAERVRDQVGGGRRDHGDPDGYRSDYRQRPQREPTWLWSEEPRSTSLYRDKKRGKLFGVCAGLGRYYGIETWVVRCAAITALLFLNWLAVVAYLVAAMILDPEPETAPRRPSRPVRRRGQRRQASPDADADARRYAPPSARTQLRTVGAGFDEMELRLRRMETHITSGSYELQREFGRLGGAAGTVN